VIGQQAKREQFHGIAFQTIGQHPLERLIIAVLVEYPHPSVPAIENVVHHAGFG